MSDIVEFLQARLDELEQAARDEIEYRKVLDPQLVGASIVIPPLMALGWDHPDFVLAEVEAKRRIMGLHPRVNDDVAPFCVTCTTDEDLYSDDLTGKWPCATIKLLATVYADHEDYDPSWRPGS